MTKSMIFRFATCLFLPCLAGFLQAAQTDEPPRPNIVIIFINDLSYGDIGPFGNTVNQTPNLDQMAREGLKLTQSIQETGHTAITHQESGFRRKHYFCHTTYICRDHPGAAGQALQDDVGHSFPRRRQHRGIGDLLVDAGDSGSHCRSSCAGRCHGSPARSRRSGARATARSSRGCAVRRARASRR